MSSKTLRILTIFCFLTSFAWICLSITKIIHSEAPDFKILWSFAKILSDGKNLYINSLNIPNPYPPITSLFYLPFTKLEYGTAQALFIFVSFSSIVATILLSLKLISRLSPWTFMAVFSLVFLSFPAKFTLGMGQQNSIAFFFILLSFVLWKKKAPVLPGILIALGASFKPVLGFVFLFYLLNKEWKIIFWSFVTFLTEFAGIFALTSSFLISDWVKQTFSYLTFEARGVYYNQGFSGFAARIFGENIFAQALVIVFSIIVLSITIYLVRKRSDKDVSFSFITTSLLLLDTMSWQHHFVWLIFPFVILGKYVLRLNNAVFTALFVIAYLMVSWNFKNPQSYPPIFLSTQFYGTLLLLGLNLYILKKRSLLTNL